MIQMYRFRKANLSKVLSIIAVVGLSISISNNLLASEAGHDKHHFVGIFVGVFDADENDTVVGLEYEYKFNSQWGVGAVYEDASDAHHGDGVSSKIAAVYFHPSGGWRLGAGFGSETVGGHESESLYRYGVSYEFHIGGVGVEPSLNFDTVDGETVEVYGVALVWAF